VNRIHDRLRNEKWEIRADRPGSYLPSSLEINNIGGRESASANVLRIPSRNLEAVFKDMCKEKEGYIVSRSLPNADFEMTLGICNFIDRIVQY
jgi:hypothetical protein